ncbi:MAG: hypothetical protein AB2374_19525 [Cytobacillus gottheilii]|uniref:hypothetical protein n=1 Tax=Cytobacillus gottheilii TaxID=859144 RepID=UPI003463A99F
MKLQFEQVSKSFKDKKVLKDISVIMESGVYGLLGSNGARKTTMIRIRADTMLSTKFLIGSKASYAAYANLSEP